MAFSNLARAFTGLSNVKDGEAFCDRVAARLHRDGETRVQALDKEIGFFALGRANDQTAELRHAARMVVRVFTLSTSPEDLAGADRWSPDDLENVIQRIARRTTDYWVGGPYFRGSFWAFSSVEERRWTIQAWNEVPDLIQAGLRTAASVRESTASANLVARWFGPNSDTPPKLVTKLEKLSSGMTEKRVGITYEGPGASRNAGRRYKEDGGEGASIEIAPNDREWGWALRGGTKTRNIALGTRFFSRQKTTALRASLQYIDADKGPSHEITRGGAVLHELTHALLDTNDQTMNQQMLDWAFSETDKAIPVAVGATRSRLLKNAASTKVARPNVHKAYAGFLCHGLARCQPDGALTNADNYRLFCEDALFYKPYQ